MEGVTKVFKLKAGQKISNGKAVISAFEFSKKKDPLYNMKIFLDGFAQGYMVEGLYVRLHVNGQLVMSDTRMEQNSNWIFCDKANGHVLIGGLGIGLVLHKYGLQKLAIQTINLIVKEAHKRSYAVKNGVQTG